MIILFHIQYDLFGFAFLMQRGAGLGVWFDTISTYISAINWAWLGILPSFFYIGVHVFFILSGYGLTKKFYAAPKFSYRSWFKQIWKLYWPYLIALPVTLLINLGLSFLLLAFHRIDSVPPVFDIYLPSQYLESILVPSRWLSGRLALNFVGTWWFVGVILQFYILLPILIVLLRKFKPKKFIIIALVVTFVYRLFVAYLSEGSTIGVRNGEILLFINFPSRFFEFALGMVLALSPSLKFFKRQTLAGVVLIVAGIASSAYVWGLAFNDIIIAMGLVLVFPALSGFLVRLGKLAKILEWFGENSYNIYLYQEPALKLILILFLGNLPL